jgi:TM2 domain-containing membrane protein YozV
LQSFTSELWEREPRQNGGVLSHSAFLAGLFAGALGLLLRRILAGLLALLLAGLVVLSAVLLAELVIVAALLLASLAIVAALLRLAGVVLVHVELLNC